MNHPLPAKVRGFHLYTSCWRLIRTTECLGALDREIIFLWLRAKQPKRGNVKCVGTASLSLRKKRISSRIEKGKAPAARRHLPFVSRPSLLCQGSSLTFCTYKLDREVSSGFPWRKPVRAKMEPSPRPPLRSLFCADRCLYCFPVPGAHLAVTCQCPLPSCDSEGDSLCSALGWQASLPHDSVYVIRCHLGLLCYRSFPECLANVTHPL